MTSDISDKIEQAKRELLGPSNAEDTRRSAIEHAIARYTARAEEAIAIANSSRYRNKQKFLDDSKKFLDQEISATKKTLNPNQVQGYRRLEDLISQRKILDHLKVEGTELTYEKLEIPKNVSNYRKLLQQLYKSTRTMVDKSDFRTCNKSMVTFITNPQDAATAIRNAADFELVLLDSSFELPTPFSQRYLKRPRKTKSVAKKHQVMQTEPAFLVPYRKTKAVFEQRLATPERVYSSQARKLRKDKNYIGIAHTGFDGRKRLQLQSNNAIGLRIFLFSEYAKKAENEGENVKPSQKLRVSKHYAHSAEGEVLSRSGIRQRYDPVVRNMADTSSDSDDSSAYSRWVDTSGDCHCKDQKYIALLHQSRAFDPVYTCPHVAALQTQYMHEEQEEGNQVLNALVFPTAEQAFYERKVNNQTMILNKDKGNVKSQLNRGEREFLLMRNLVERGYEHAATTDFAKAKTAMKQLYRLQ